MQNGSVLLTCEYYSTLFVHFLFVVTDESGQGGMETGRGVARSGAGL